MGRFLLGYDWGSTKVCLGFVSGFLGGLFGVCLGMLKFSCRYAVLSAGVVGVVGVIGMNSMVRMV